MTENEKNQIKSLIQDSRWRIVENLAQEICNKIALEEMVDRDTEWETTKGFLLARGQILGIQRLLKTMWEALQ